MAATVHSRVLSENIKLKGVPQLAEGEDDAFSMPWHFILGEWLTPSHLPNMVEVYNASKSSSPLDPGFFSDLQTYITNRSVPRPSSTSSSNSTSPYDSLSASPSTPSILHEQCSLKENPARCVMSNEDTSCYPPYATHNELQEKEERPQETDFHPPISTKSVLLSLAENKKEKEKDKDKEKALGRTSAMRPSSPNTNSITKLVEAKQICERIAKSSTAEAHSRHVEEEIENWDIRQKYYSSQIALMQTLTDISCLIKAMKLPSKVCYLDLNTEACERR